MIVVGSPSYFVHRKPPKDPQELRGHACLRMRRSSGAVALWSLKQGNRAVEIAVAGPFIANDFPTILGAALEGIGLAQVPKPIAASALLAGKLVEVLAPFASTAPGVFLYYPDRHQMLPKLRAFIDHVKGQSTVHGKIE
jgi:DNA-binding transcriptional LysR family regulator